MIYNTNTAVFFEILSIKNCFLRNNTAGVLLYYLNFYALPTLPILKLQNLDIFTTMEDMNIEQNAEAKHIRLQFLNQDFGKIPNKLLF